MNTAEFLTITAGSVPDRVALTDPNESVTYSALLARVQKLAHAFAMLGVGKGNNVGMMSVNAVAFPEIYYATAMVGATFVPLNYRARADELAYMVDAANVNVLFVSERYFPLLQQVRTSLPTLEHVYALDFAPEGEETLEQLRAQGIEEPFYREVEDDDPVRIFVMGGGDGSFDSFGRIQHGGGWRVEQAWPLERANETPLYLTEHGKLGMAPPRNSGNSTTWVHDPENPVPTVSGNVTGFYEWIVLPDDLDGAYVPQRARMRSLIPDGPLHQKERPSTVVSSKRPANTPALLADRADVNVFQTEPLAADVEVTGPIVVNLWISSDAVDTDFTAKLIDVYPPSEMYPEGFHLPLEDSIRRARFRDGFDSEKVMEPGEVYEVQIELPPVSNLFVQGHRIRLDISSSNFPRFDVNPNTGEPIGRHTRSQRASNTVYNSAEYPSHVLLPVVGNKPSL